jgi:hypothetical protein
MVDRPIKKVDHRNPAVESDSNPRSSEAPSKKSISSRGADKGGRRDSNKRDEPRAPENLALMRGPKPSRVKPPIINEAATRSFIFSEGLLKSAFFTTWELSQESETQELESKEKEIETILAKMELSNIRIQEHQEEIDSLKVDTKIMIANLTALIK